jgi:methyltransferase (TIGR00027 family)
MTEPDNTAIRVALWRALHLELDASPPVLADPIGLRLVRPDPEWRARPDMDPLRTRTMRASIVVRARLIEDLVAEQKPAQYVLLGAGLDTFAWRGAPAGLRIFEVDQAGTQAWKQARVRDEGLSTPAGLAFVPVDFASESWLDRITAAGFDPALPTVVASTGVIMYLQRDAIRTMLEQVASLPRVTLACSFLVPVDQMAQAERPGFAAAMRGAAAQGTPFVSFFARDEIVGLARAAGFEEARVVTSGDLNARYFAGRTDGLATGTGEEILVATNGWAAIRAAEGRLRTAMLASDVAALDALLHRDLRFAGPDGVVVGKEADLEAHRSGRERIGRLDLGEARLRWDGDDVLVTVDADMAGAFDGAPFGGRFRYERRWTRTNAGWQVTAGSVTPVG